MSAAAQRDTRTQVQRHRAFEPETFARYCELLGSGATTREAAKLLGVQRGTLFAWTLALDASAADQYARAREAQAEVHADNILEEANEVLQAARDGSASSEWVNAARIAIDAKKWAASKLRPKVYGDRIDVALQSEATLVLLDYGRSERMKPAIDVTPRPMLEAGAPTPKTRRAALRKPKQRVTTKRGAKVRKRRKPGRKTKR